MEREEKAKAYDEAVNKIKPLYEQAKRDGNPIWSTYEYLIPELRESEDERIRKWIYSLVENLGYPADEDAKKELEEMQPLALAYLEKQKENPKTADSIPTDCMLDAKCEDRWHKVADSMPDNPREVLCKDEAGNYFIGRYYVGEGWEISNYDDEDKPHHLNPPVSKWIDFPLERQKEQKPIIQDVELNDAVYDYVRDHFIAGADFTPEYIKKLMENAFFAGVDYYLLKQESESCEPDTNVEKVIEDVIRVYGKTQGEYIGGYDVDSLIVNLRRAFNKKEQKPAEWTLPEDFEEAVYKVANFISPFDNQEELRKTSHRFAEQLLSLAKKELDKPAEWSEVELEFRGEKVKVKRPFFRDDNGRGYSTTEQDEEVSWNALRAWCEKKGVSMYDLYPRAEWSEEDEKKIHFLSRLIEFQVKDDEYCFGDGRLISKKEAIEMLRSLRPSWKPSEEQMEAFKGYIEDFQAKAEAAVGGWNNFDVMIQLFEQLNKLMQKG